MRSNEPKKCINLLKRTHERFSAGLRALALVYVPCTCPHIHANAHCTCLGTIWHARRFVFLHSSMSGSGWTCANVHRSFGVASVFGHAQLRVSMSTDLCACAQTFVHAKRLVLIRTDIHACAPTCTHVHSVRWTNMRVCRCACTIVHEHGHMRSGISTWADTCAHTDKTVLIHMHLEWNKSSLVHVWICHRWTYFPYHYFDKNMYILRVPKYVTIWLSKHGYRFTTWGIFCNLTKLYSN